MNKIVKNALILMAITLVSGTLLGLVYEITKDPIAEAELKAQQEAYMAVFPGEAELAESDARETWLESSVSRLESAGYGDNTIEDWYLMQEDGQTVGVVMNITSHAGYGGDINFSMGIAVDGTVQGVEILSISETAGLGMRATEEEFKGQFAGKKADTFSVTKTGASADHEIDAISGATITSNAMTNGVNAGVCFYQSLKEGGILHE